MNKHTPEPWKIGTAKALNAIGIFENFAQDDGEKYDAVCLISPIDSFAQIDADNADRIVQCVNACAGMDNPAAEIAKLKAENEQWSADFWKLHKERTNAEREVAKLKADKARLVEALKEAIPYLERSIEKHGRETADALREMLTEIEAQE